MISHLMNLPCTNKHMCDTHTHWLPPIRISVMPFNPGSTFISSLLFGWVSPFLLGSCKWEKARGLGHKKVKKSANPLRQNVLFAYPFDSGALLCKEHSAVFLKVITITLIAGCTMGLLSSYDLALRADRGLE